MTKNQWPREIDCDKFYGNPRGKNGQVNPVWYAKNIVVIKPPFKMTYGGKPISGIRCHRLVAESLKRILLAIWIKAGRKQEQIAAWHFDEYSGFFEYRLKRESTHISMHGYGIAGDWASSRYPFKQTKKRFCKEVVEEFTKEGWINLPHDPMHFQAAIPN